MIYEKIDLNAEFPGLPKNKRSAILECYCRSKLTDSPKDKFPAMIVCPGGGYWGTAPHEGEPVAMAMLGAGIQSFVLWYTVPDSCWPQYHLELAAAVIWIRRNAERLGVDENAISVLGFSAGCHLAGSYSVNWGNPMFSTALGAEREELRVNGMVLCYGVLFSEGELSHKGSMQNLFKGTETPELLKMVSVPDNITDETPPAFIWHTAEDGGVPVENSLSVAAAMHAAGRPFELHVYPHGCHGLSLGTWLIEHPDNRAKKDRTVSKWVKDCTDWVMRTFGYDF
ncbi:MAG: alpha/beta hydrolase [Clostridia bacterium]|nr:alpha/beta hydrolase [Clostridia bacterium]